MRNWLSINGFAYVKAEPGLTGDVVFPKVIIAGHKESVFVIGGQRSIADADRCIGQLGPAVASGVVFQKIGAVADQMIDLAVGQSDAAAGTLRDGGQTWYRGGNFPNCVK